jgi:hypothetical protein
MNQIIYQALAADTVVLTLLADQGDAVRLYARGQLGRDGVSSSPRTPYVMFGEGAVAAEPSVNKSSPDTAAVTYTFYAYDATGSAEKLKKIHRELRRVMLALSGTLHGTVMITNVVWLSLGGDGFDSVSRNNVKTQTFRVVGRV